MHVEGPWFDHEDKLPNRPLYRIPEALALGNYTINRALVEATIMILKSTVQILRFFAAAIFVSEARNPKYYYTLGILTLVAGIAEAILGFWKEVAARVHLPGSPRYYDSPHAAHRGWYS